MAWKLRWHAHTVAGIRRGAADPKDVVAMPSLSRQRPATEAARQPRRAAPRCRGGVSSLLRLAQPAQPRLPTPASLGHWMNRASKALQPAALPAFAPSELHA